MFRLAAIGDLHIWGPIPHRLIEEFEALRDNADVLVIAGDITNNGLLVQAERAVGLLSRAKLPMLAVLGNHDRRSLRRQRFREIIEQAGVTFLDGSSVILGNTETIGVAGVSGSGGGFWPIEGPDTLSRRAAQLLAIRGRREAARLETALSALETDYRVVVTHVSPTLSTCAGEPKAKFWLLGNCELAQVVDRQGVDLVIHGHAHRGFPRGQTSGGTPVHNVAKNVVGGIVYLDVRNPQTARMRQLIEATA